MSVLRNELVCGYKDISRESYAGFSGKHDVGGQAIRTNNGAGPHNLQMFVLAPDSTVMHCLPGYWAPADLVREIEFAGRLHDVWTDRRMSNSQKNEQFRVMQLAHIDEHPRQMVTRSRMQSFDMEHEAKFNLNNSDTIKDRGRAYGVNSEDMRAKRAAMGAFKTTDQLLHERMAKRPFVSYTNFDVAQYADYGRPLYDKNEDFRDANGRFVENGRVIEGPPQRARQKELLGKVPDRLMQRRRMTSDRSADRTKWGNGDENRQRVKWGSQ